MIGFRVRLQELPEQPGERRISVHWFFLPVGLGYSAAGVAGVRDSMLNARPLSKYWGAACAILGVFVLITFVLCLKRMHQGKPPESLFTIRVRQLVLFGSMVGYMVLCFVIYRLLPGQMALAIPFIWLFGSPFIWNGTVRYFREHPPKH